MKKPYHASDADMFKSDQQLNRLNVGDDGCERRAISIWNNIQSVRMLVGNWENATRYGIREMKLNAESGVVHPHPHRHPGHFVWWIPDQINPVDLCRGWLGSKP